MTSFAPAQSNDARKRSHRFVIMSALNMYSEPIGLAAGDANIRRFVGNDPLNFTDPTGLVERNVNGYEVLDIGGHHRVPVEVWGETGFEGEVFKIWDNAGARICQPDGAGHNYGKHGSKIGYTGHVQALLRQELSAYIAANAVDGKLTVQQQKDFANTFLRKIESMPTNTYIGGYNEAVRQGGNQAVKTWWESKGCKLKPPSLGTPITIAGTLRPAINAGAKVARVAGVKALSAVNALDTVEMAHDELLAAQSPLGTIYGTYYFRDEHGTYHYEQLGSGVHYRGTDAVYDSGLKAGEREPTFWFWGRIKVFIKRLIDPPKVDWTKITA
ncbi:MAG: hypothetical protein SFU86_01965 [Pirellulaceae bacterium]|nr:hypothetical protein [Pirellulaceae bacterium]